MLRRRRSRILFATTFIFALFVAGLGARLYTVFSAVDPFGWRIVRAPAYRTSPYWSIAFIREQAGFTDTIHFDAGSGNLMLAPYHSNHFNTCGFWRCTPGQPAYPRHRLYLFGSSTILGAEVPDSLTISGFLQTHLIDYAVENRGISAATATVELNWLRKTALQPGDAVVFYDGAVDAEEPCLILENRRATINEVALTQISSEALGEYRRAIADARLYTARRHVLFLHFVQPQIWSHPLNDYERKLGIDGCLKDSVTLTYPTLEQADAQAVILTHALDAARDRGEAIYLDQIHVNEEGNSIIAAAIFDTLTLI